MPVVAIQGLRGGVGATSLTAAIAWALNALGESVLAIDVSPVNQLGCHFNTPVDEPRGWMRAQCDGADWRQSALRYQPGLDFLPFGRLTHQERETVYTYGGHVQAGFLTSLSDLKTQYRWLLLDLPCEPAPWLPAVLTQTDRLLQVMTPDANCHLRLHQQRFARNTLFLINQFNANSKLQQDLHQLWSSSLKNLLPLRVHRDEALAEALLMKQPLGEYRPHSLASEEIVTLANWLILHAAGTPS
jgi:cellulose synthase operon protein YhjQ